MRAVRKPASSRLPCPDSQHTPFSLIFYLQFDQKAIGFICYAIFSAWRHEGSEHKLACVKVRATCNEHLDLITEKARRWKEHSLILAHVVLGLCIP